MSVMRARYKLTVVKHMSVIPGKCLKATTLIIININVTSLKQSFYNVSAQSFQLSDVQGLRLGFQGAQSSSDFL